MFDDLRSCDHVGGHSITDKEDDVLGLADLGQVSDLPVCYRSSSVVVSQGGSVHARILEEHSAVGF